MNRRKWRWLAVGVAAIAAGVLVILFRPGDNGELAGMLELHPTVIPWTREADIEASAAAPPEWDVEYVFKDRTPGEVFASLAIKGDPSGSLDYGRDWVAYVELPSGDDVKIAYSTKAPGCWVFLTRYSWMKKTWRELEMALGRR